MKESLLSFWQEFEGGLVARKVKAGLVTGVSEGILVIK
jgi:hypothetical protein